LRGFCEEVRDILTFCVVILTRMAERNIQTIVFERLVWTCDLPVRLY
jgi:hypothetical protein